MVFKIIELSPYLLVFTLICVLFLGIGNYQDNWLDGMVLGCITGIFVAAAILLFAILKQAHNDNTTNQETRYTTKNIFNIFLCFGLLGAMLGGIGSGFGDSLSDRLGISQIGTPWRWIIFALFIWVGLLIMFSIVAVEIKDTETHNRPNEGIISSAYSARNGCLFSGLLFILFFGFLSIFSAITSYKVDEGLNAKIFVPLIGGPIIGLFFSLIVGPIVALNYGGRAIIQHYTLRLLLYFNHLTPLHYEKFLDHAADRVLLRRVGGGWVFVHRLLLEHFAERKKEEVKK